MPTFRVIIERTVVSREIVELSASTLHEAASRTDSFAGDRAGRNGRGIVIVRPHDDDASSTQDDRVVQITQK